MPFGSFFNQFKNFRLLDVKILNKEARDLLTQFDFVAIRHIYRDKNEYADSITNNVLKSKQSFFKKI